MQNDGLPIGKDELSEQAAAWFLRLKDAECSEADRQAFAAWLSASQRHEDEYRQYERLWGRLDSLDRTAATWRSGALGRSIALLAAVALGMGAGWWWRAAPEEVLVTGIGERHHVTLADGTEVDINADSRLVVALGRSKRQLTVERGEALFAVAADAGRPFEVRAGAGVLRDIGTAFDVAVEGERVSVGVLQGAVELRLPQANQVATLSGGQRMGYTALGLGEPQAFDTETALAWRSGRFVFRETPLDEVLRQLNRYHPRQAILADADLARLRVSGAFNVADRDGLLRALEALFPLRCRETQDGTQLAWAGRKP